MSIKKNIKSSSKFAGLFAIAGGVLVQSAQAAVPEAITTGLADASAAQVAVIGLAITCLVAGLVIRVIASRGKRL